MNDRKKTISIVVVITLLIIAGGVFYFDQSRNRITPPPTTDPSTPQASPSANAPQTQTIAENLSVPWDLAFLPNGDILITERSGVIKRLYRSSDLHVQNVITIDEVHQTGEGGLHGIVLHPDFTENNNVYIYYTYAQNGGNTLNRVVRYTYQENSFSDPQIIVDEIPGALFHDGGRVRFGPDGHLYISTGDAQVPSLAQTRDSLAGKILRVTDTGEPAPGNPFGTRIYSYGHRNPQGIAWDDAGNLWATEHGNNATDEVNLIEPGNNFGWPTITGDETQSGMVSPVIQSGQFTTWAPAGLAFHNGSLYFGGLRGQALYEAPIDDESIEEVIPHFEEQYGRIRAVTAGPDGLLYISTSNRDGRGDPRTGDDKIIQVNPEKL